MAENDSKEDVDDLFNLLMKRSKIITEIEENNIKINEDNEEISKKVAIYEEEINSKRFCIHCFSSFYPMENKSNSCVHHPGKMMYFSCK